MIPSFPPPTGVIGFATQSRIFHPAGGFLPVSRLAACMLLLAVTGSPLALLASPVTELGPRDVGTPDPDWQARRAAVYESLARDAKQVAEPLAVLPTYEQLDRLTNQTCSTCPGGKSTLHLAGVAAASDTVVSFADWESKSLTKTAQPLDIGLARLLDDGTAVWTTAVVSPGAEEISVTFADLALPSGVELYVYNQHGQYDGPYVGDGGLGTGSNWTNPLMGDELGIEIRVHPNKVDGPLVSKIAFTLASVNHFGDGSLRGIKTSCTGQEPCIESAECYTTSRFAGLDGLRRAVASILFPVDSDFYNCSGGLVNHTAADPLPFFLTANHCFDSSASATGARFYWDYRKSSCADSSCPSRSTFPNQQGATLLHTSASQDVTFIRLNSTPPGQRTYMGWTSGAIHDNATVNLFRVHHPKGDPQMYSEQRVNSGSSTCSTLPRGNFVYSDDTLHATDGGSSGSIVVNGSSQIVGQLYGACGPNPDDPCGDNRTVDGAFARYFNDVRTFLDPSGTPVPTPTPTATPIPTTNDTFPGPTLSGSTGSIDGTNANSTRETGEPAHVGNSTAGTVWYTWTAPATGTAEFNTCTAASYDTMLAAYTGSSVGGLTRLAENDDSCGTESRITFNVTAGVAYRIVVLGFDGDQGTFTLSWQATGTPTATPTPTPTPGPTTVPSVTATATPTPTPTPIGTATPTPPPGGDDAWEGSNNSRGGATLIPTNTWIEPLVLLNTDWYKFQFAACTNIKVTMEFVHTQGNLQMQLFDARCNTADGKGFLRGASYSGNNSEVVFYVNNTGSTELFLEVYGQNGATNPNYRLRIDELPIDDNFEPNNGPNQALNFAFGGRVDNLICREDDWFRVNIPTGTNTIDVMARFQTQSGDLHVEVYGAETDDWTGKLANSYNTRGDQDFEWVQSLNVAGRSAVRVRVFGNRLNTNVYSLHVAPGGTLNP